ncbi:MAG: HEAT repeat domain-containing protein [Thermodesulfobacteriota bacterium]
MEHERPNYSPASGQSDVSDLTVADEGLTHHRKRISFSAKQVRKEILSGIPVAELMERYGLSEKGLKKFLRGVLEQAVVSKGELDRWQSARDSCDGGAPARGEPGTGTKILGDLRSGLSKVELMDKHGLTSEQLETVVNQAIAKGTLDPSELDAWTQKVRTAEFRNLFIDEMSSAGASPETAEIELPAGTAEGRPDAPATMKQVKGAEGIEYLIESIGRRDTRETARRQLMALGAQAVDPLLQAIDHDDVEVRSRIPLLLADLGAVQAVEPIIALLHDPDADVRESALMALDTLRDTRSLDPVLDALRHDPEPHNRRLAAIHVGHLKDSRSVPALLEALRTDADDWARAGAAIGLANFANIPRVRTALLESSANLNYSATSVEAMDALRRSGAAPLISREESPSPPGHSASPPEKEGAPQAPSRRATVVGIVIGVLLGVAVLWYFWAGSFGLF